MLFDYFGSSENVERKKANCVDYTTPKNDKYWDGTW